jgi:hypothetical protein
VIDITSFALYYLYSLGVQAAKNRASIMADEKDDDNLFQTPQNDRKTSRWHTSRHSLERVENHPLSEDYGSIEPSSSVDTASLIQSAARSILDDTSPNTAVSDDESDAEGSFATRAALSPSPTLSSLQMKTLPAMPDEQDRKRFVVSCRLWKNHMRVIWR